MSWVASGERSVIPQRRLAFGAFSGDFMTPTPLFWAVGCRVGNNTSTLINRAASADLGRFQRIYSTKTLEHGATFV
jgi:hypothetical protein